MTQEAHRAGKEDEGSYFKPQQVDDDGGDDDEDDDDGDDDDGLDLWIRKSTFPASIESILFCCEFWETEQILRCFSWQMISEYNR